MAKHCHAIICESYGLTRNQSQPRRGCCGEEAGCLKDGNAPQRALADTGAPADERGHLLQNRPCLRHEEHPPQEFLATLRPNSMHAGTELRESAADDSCERPALGSATCRSAGSKFTVPSDMVAGQ